MRAVEPNNQQYLQYLVSRLLARIVYRVPSSESATLSLKSNFTESLILAQDERWRRA